MITTKDVENMAKLSRLEFSETELKAIKSELNDIIGCVNTLKEVNTTTVSQSYNTIDAEYDLREDIAELHFTQHQAIQNAQVKRDGAFSVPPVLD